MTDRNGLAAELLRRAPRPILAFGDDGLLFDLNRRAALLLGRDRGDLRGAPFADMVDFDGLNWHEFVHKLANTSETDACPLLLRRPENVLLEFRATAKEVHRQSGTPLLLITVECPLEQITLPSDAVPNTDFSPSPDAVTYWLDHATDEYIYLQPDPEKLIGIPADELTPRRWSQLVRESFRHPWQQPQHDPIDRLNAYHNGDIPVYRMMHRIVTPSKEEKWIHDTAVGILDANTSRLALSMGIARDVTARYRTEKKLTESRDAFQELVELLPQPVYEADTDGIVTFANKKALESLKYTQQDLQEGVKLTDAIVPEDRKRAAENIQKILAGKESSGTRYTALRKDKTTFPVSIYSAPIIRDGSVTGMRAVAVDMSDIEKAQQQLRKNEQLFRSVFEGMQDVFYRADADGNIVLINPALKDLTGYTPDDVIGTAAKIYFADPEEHRRLVEEIKQKGSVSDREITVKKKNDEQFVASISAHARTDDDGAFIGTEGILRDISSRKHAERHRDKLIDELKSRNQALRRFADGMSHDIKQPMRTISLTLQMLEDDYAEELDEQTTRRIEYAVHAARRTMELFDVLSQMSRVRADTEPLQPADMNDVLAAVIEDLSAAIDANDATVESEPLPQVMGNTGQLQILLRNLIGNAIKYRSDEPLIIHVTAQRENDTWKFSVSDNGIGIPQADTDRVFRLFERGSEVEDSDGLGVGLALAMRVIERHDGDLWVESECGDGATFYFTLQAAE